MTQENLSEPRPEYQTLINLNGEDVWIDNEFIVLIQELNQLGLITRSHCAGHETGQAFLIIRMDSINEITIRDKGEYKELVLHWNRLTEEKVNDG